MENRPTASPVESGTTFGPEPHGLGQAGFPLAIAALTIDTDSPLTIYEQICRAVRSAIAAGDLPPGTPLPTSRELARSLGVGRNTVVTAYTRLAAEGYLVSNTRRGTRVARAPSDLPSAAFEPRRAQQDGGRAHEIAISFHARHALAQSAAEPAASLPLAPHAPDPSLYPRNALSRLLADEFCRCQGGDTRQGLVHFQAAIADFLRNMRGVQCEPGQVIPITGLQSALDLTARVMLDPGHCAYVEDPACNAVRNCFRAAGAHIMPMPADEDGPDIGRVSGPPPRLIYAYSSVSFPFGRQTCEARRLALLEAAREKGGVIFENDSQWELTYAGGRIRAMQGSAWDAPVIYFSHFNQTLGPHVQVGYLVVPQSLAEPFMAMAQRIAYGPEPFMLAALATFIESGQYALHARTLRSIYAARLAVLVEACRARLPELTCVEPVGGLNLALVFKKPIDDEAVCRAAADRGLSLASLSRFHARDEGKRGLVLGFGSTPDRAIDTVVGRLAEILADHRAPAKLAS